MSKAFVLTNKVQIKDNFFVVSNEAPIVLSNYYDPEQEWFTFMTGTILVYDEQQELPKTNKSKKNSLKKRASKNYAKLEDFHRKMYKFEENQYVLPFKEFRKLSASSYGALNALGFPCFERNENNQLFEFRYFFSTKDLFWMEKNFQGIYFVNNQYCLISIVEDAILLKLRIGK